MLLFIGAMLAAWGAIGVTILVWRKFGRPDLIPEASALAAVDALVPLVGKRRCIVKDWSTANGLGRMDG